MKIHRQLVYWVSAVALATALASCARPHDLDTPCPDYGRQCSQSLINT